MNKLQLKNMLEDTLFDTERAERIASIIEIIKEVKRKSNKAYNIALDNLINDIDFYKLLTSKRCNVELDTDALLQAIEQARNEK